MRLLGVIAAAAILSFAAAEAAEVLDYTDGAGAVITDGEATPSAASTNDLSNSSSTAQGWAHRWWSWFGPIGGWFDPTPRPSTYASEPVGIALIGLAGVGGVVAWRRRQKSAS